MTLHTRARLRADGSLELKIPPEVAPGGEEVDVTVERAAAGSNGAPSLTREQKLAILDRTAGSIPDFARLSSGNVKPIPRLQSE